MVGWMSYWSHRSETGVRSRRWSRRMAAFSWALGRFRVFLGMGEPPLEIVAYSSDPFFPFRLKQNTGGDYFPLEIYQAEASDCAGCPLKARCVRGRSGARTVRRQEHEDLIEGLKERMNTPEAKRKYRDRCCTVERRFADWKTHRGLQRFSGRTPERADA